MLARSDIFSATYKRCDLVTDLRSLASTGTEGIQRQMNKLGSARIANFARGWTYEVQTAAKITRMATDYGFTAPVTKVDFIGLGIRSSEGTTDLDAVVTLASGRKVILQCKSGSLGSAPEARAWVAKASAWANEQGSGVFELKYVAPAGPQTGNAFDRAVNEAIDRAISEYQGTIIREGSPYVLIPTTW